MKKLVVLLTVGALAFGMTACTNNNQGTESTESSVAESTTESTQESTEPTEETTPSTEEMDVSSGWSEEMETIKQAVVTELGEDYWPNSQLQPDVVESFYGITNDMYDDYMAEMPMISANVDTLLIIKAKDGNVEAVEAAVNAYRDNLMADTMQYPANLGKIQASRVETIGNYVCFVQLGADTMVASESGDEAVIEQCQEHNDRAIEAIKSVIQQ